MDANEGKRPSRAAAAADAWRVDAAPGRVLFGAGVIDLVGDVVRDLGGGRVLVVADPGIAAAGHVHRAAVSLRRAGLSVAVFYGVEENPGERHVAAAAAAARAHQASFLVGLGGGSAMDCAKGANFVFTNGGRMEDYWGFGKATKPMLPAVGIPCTAGTGSEAQSYAVISREDDHRKMACGDPGARFAASLLDPELVRTAPRAVMAASGLDALSHAVESFVTTAANPTSRQFASEGFRRLLRGFEAVAAAQAPDDRASDDLASDDLAPDGRTVDDDNVDDENDEAALRGEQWGEMLLGAHFAGAAIEASMLGAAHGLANPLTARYDIAHGVAVAVMLDHVVRFNGATDDARYDGLARLLDAQRPQDMGAGADGGDACAVAASARLADAWGGFRRRVGVASRLRDLGVEEADLASLATLAAEQWTARFNPRPADASDMLALYQAAF